MVPISGRGIPGSESHSNPFDSETPAVAWLLGTNGVVSHRLSSDTLTESVSCFMEGTRLCPGSTRSLRSLVTCCPEVSDYYSILQSRKQRLPELNTFLKNRAVKNGLGSIRKLVVLSPCSSVCGPRTSSLRITWRLIRRTQNPRLPW